MWYREIINEVYLTFMEMAPYLLLGLTFAGVLHVLFKKEFVARHLGGNGIMSSIKASIFGVPLPLCSCGVIPTALSLRKSNASEGSVVSFLISTPQTGVDSIIATYGMLGPVFAIFRPIAAFIMGIAGGVITGLTVKPAKKASFVQTGSETVQDSDHDVGGTILDKVKKMVTYGYGSFLDDISIQLVVGILISGIISWAVPDDFFTNYVSDGIGGMLLMIIAGIPLYVCATASIPIAVALMIKGLSPGAAFVFLAAGPATNAATITLITNAMGKKVVTIYLSVIAVGAILAGYALNFVYSFINVDPVKQIAHQHVHVSISTYLISGFFGVLVLLSLLRKSGVLKSRGTCTDGSFSTGGGNTTTTIPVTGMTCHHCADHVTKSIRQVKGVESVSVDLHGAKAAITGHFDLEQVKEAVVEAGYKTS